MTETVLSSATKEVAIGFERPFVIIGERINPTGRKQLAAEMAAGNFDTVVADAIAQVEAGAQMLDVNAGIPLADEPAILAQTVELVQSITDVPLSIDSSIVEALEAGLAVYQGKALVNSVTGEDEQMERVLPLVARHGAAVVAISNDETGISEDPDVRFEVARRIVSRAADHGIPAADVVVDPLVMPIGAMGTAGRQVFRLVRRLREELGVNTTCGASNISFGLPNRPGSQRGLPADGDRVGDDLGHHEPAARGDAEGGVGGRRDDGQRRALRGLDRASRRHAGRGPERAARRTRGSQEDRDRLVTSNDHLVVFTPSGRRSRFAAGHDGARRGAPARRRSRLGVRRPRHLRPLPGRGVRGRARQARHHVVGRGTSPRSARSSGRTRPTAGSRPAGGSAARRSVTGDVVVDVPPESQVYRQVVRKEADAHPIEVDPVVRLYLVEVEQPELASPASDLTRLAEALEREWGLTGLACDTNVLHTLQATLRDGGWQVTVAVHDGDTITGDLAGLPRPRLRDRVRRRLDHGRGSPLRPLHGRGARVGGRDEPADPLRRGPDEPRLVRDDERRRRRRS